MKNIVEVTGVYHDLDVMEFDILPQVEVYETMEGSHSSSKWGSSRSPSIPFPGFKFREPENISLGGNRAEQVLGLGFDEAPLFPDDT